MNKEQKLIILASIIGLSLMMMNVIVVAIAIPQITSSIPFTSISSHWIINIYALAMAVAGTVVGKISDIIQKYYYYWVHSICHKLDWLYLLGNLLLLFVI